MQMPMAAEESQELRIESLSFRKKIPVVSLEVMGICCIFAVNL